MDDRDEIMVDDVIYFPGFPGDTPFLVHRIACGSLLATSDDLELSIEIYGDGSFVKESIPSGFSRTPFPNIKYLIKKYENTIDWCKNGIEFGPSYFPREKSKGAIEQLELVLHDLKKI